jgi:hypothetical protein
MTSEPTDHGIVVTSDSIDGTEDALSAIEALIDRPVPVSEIEVTLDLSESETERVEAVIEALSDGISVETDSPEGRAVDHGRGAGGDPSRGPSDYDLPDDGEVQPSPAAYDPPKLGTIQYAALALLCAKTTADGETWLTAREIAELDSCPYTFEQVSGAISRLWRTEGCVSRRGIEDGAPSEVQYRPGSSAREYVSETGPFPWPDDAEVPHSAPDPKPFYVTDE